MVQFDKIIRKDGFESEVFRAYYPNECLIYVSSDLSFTHSPNKLNFSKCSSASDGIKCTEGEQPNGLFWKEVVKNNLVIGYKNIPKELKKEFDNSISSLKEL